MGRIESCVEKISALRFEAFPGAAMPMQKIVRVALRTREDGK